MTSATGSERPPAAVHLESEPKQRRGCLIINADDWGRDRNTTDRIADCAAAGALSSASAMVFMEDSERSADIARQRKIDVGLHLNLTTEFSATECPTRLRDEQKKLAVYLSKSPFARAIFNPVLAGSFEYVVKAQLEQYQQLYGTMPVHVDGHHHMHLATNVVFQRLLPKGTVQRRHFSYEPGEKRVRNFLFRTYADLMTGKRSAADYLFSLPPMDAARLQRIFRLAAECTVELETHPVNPQEFSFLAGGEIFRWLGETRIATGYSLPQ